LVTAGHQADGVIVRQLIVCLRYDTIVVVLCLRRISSCSNEAYLQQLQQVLQVDFRGMVVILFGLVYKAISGREACRQLPYQ